MFDRNLIYWCRTCECVSYICPECTKNLCGGNYCDVCIVLADHVWAWLDEQNIDEEILKKSGKVVDKRDPEGKIGA